MDRRDFLKTATVAVSALAAQGTLPLLGAKKNSVHNGHPNCLTEPSALEPVTGYLPRFEPAGDGSMREPFEASYSLIGCHGSAASSRNSVMGTLQVRSFKSHCRTTEKRAGAPANVVETCAQCSGELRTAAVWTLNSSIEGRDDLRFAERGEWDGKTMSVTSDGWKQVHPTSNPLIARWALLSLLASGALKKKPMVFDMLDDSALRPDQTLRFVGQINVKMKEGPVGLDCYAQTGRGIVPTHYLVDGQGRVQLITMTTVNWALQGLKHL